MKRTLLTLFVLAFLPMMANAQADQKLITKAHNGDTKAMVLLGECYELGAGVDMDSTLALKWFQRAANAGDGEGWIRVSRYYLNSTLMPRDTARYVAIRKQWADSGLANAIAAMAEIYQFGLDVKADTAKARELLEQSVAQGSSWGLEDMGVNYTFGINGYPKDTKKALNLLNKSYKNGNIHAANDIARCYYYNGDIKNAQKWIAEAAKWNDPDAATLQATLLFNGPKGIEKDQAKAIQILTDLTKKHHNLSFSQGLLGYYYSTADSNGLRNTDKAIKIWTDGTHLANPVNCELNLGYYYAGIGEFDKAYPYFVSAASKSKVLHGDGDACYELAKLHASGLGCDSSMTKCISWLERGVEEFQNSDCAITLASLYSNEEYHDLPQAVSYYRLADKYGDNTAMQKLGVLYYQNGNQVAAMDCFDKMIENGNPDGYFWKSAIYEQMGSTKECNNMLNTAAKKGSALANHTLGSQCEMGVNGKPNYKKAAQYYTKADIPASHYRLGVMTLDGKLGKLDEKSTAQGLAYIEQAADEGFVDAIYTLGNIYENGLVNDSVNMTKAAEYYQTLADNNIAAGQFKMGCLNETGYDDVAADTAKAAQYYQLATEQGHGEAMCFLGDFYRSGIFFDTDSAKAFDYYTRAHESGEEIGTYYIGRSYLEGCGVNIDSAYAVPFLKAAAAQGVGNAAYKVADFYNYGKGGLEPNGDSAVYYYFKGHEYGSGEASNFIGQSLLQEQKYDQATNYLFVGARRGNVDAMVSYASCLQQGIGFKEANPKVAYSVFERVAKNYGDSRAYTALGLACLQGNGCPEDEPLAKSYFDTAANMGNVNAMYYLAVCQLNGYGCRIDTASAISWLEQAADNESIRAINALGDVYEDQGDFKNAVLYFEKGVAMGSLESYCNLGYCYEQGQGVVLNSKKAYELYMYAAEHEYNRGMRCIAGCYIHGIYVEESMKEALNWFTKAADNGDVVAMYYCGAILEEGGDDVPVDLKAARKYYQMAAKAGYEPAAAALSRM